MNCIVNNYDVELICETVGDSDIIMSKDSRFHSMMIRLEGVRSYSSSKSTAK